LIDTPNHRFLAALCGKHRPQRPVLAARDDDTQTHPDSADDPWHSGIFGYINYLVEKDRKYILNTLINGKSRPRPPARLPR
jgi:hypothetical protein